MALARRAPVLTDRQWERMRARAASRPDERIVFVADVWLDRPDVVANLERMLTVFQSLVRVPALVVLMVRSAGLGWYYQCQSLPCPGRVAVSG